MSPTPLTVLHPTSGGKVAANFPVIGRYQYPNRLVASVFRILPMPAAFITRVQQIPGGPADSWYCHFHLGNARPGRYILAVVDPTAPRPTAVYLPIIVQPSRSGRFLLGSFPQPTYPTAGTSTNHNSFHSDDTAYGIAAGCTPSFSSHFTFTGGGNPHVGFPLPPDPNSPPGYWAHAYLGIRTNGNPATFHIQDSAIPANTDDEDYIDIVATGRSILRKTRKKKGKSKVRGKK